MCLFTYSYSSDFDIFIIIVLIVMCLFTYSYSLDFDIFKRFMFQDFCKYIFLFAHFFVKFVPDTIRFFYVFCNPRLRLNFFSFLVDFSIGACLSRVLLKSRKKFSKPKSISLFSVEKFQFISRRSLLKGSMLKYRKSL